MTSSYLTRTLACACLLACAAAQGGRPMVVDDASILDPGDCQLEAWIQQPRGQTESWAMPACRVGAWELGIGLGHVGPDEGAAYRAHILQAKTVFRPLRTNDWGIGLTLADQYRQGAGLSGDIALLVPLSVSLLEDRLLVHANAGWLRRRGARNGATWALGAEWAAARAWALTLEAYGQQHGHGYVQAGARLDAIPGRLALDAGVGRRASPGGGERYFTVGLTLAGPVLR